MAIKNRIGLRIPDQSPPIGKIGHMNDKEVLEWISSLPLANIGETSRQIFHTLREQNKTLIPYKKRFQCSEPLREPVNYIGSNLERYYLNIGFPLSVKAHKIAILNRELHSSLATAYKSVTVDIILANAVKSDQKILATAIHRAIFHLSQLMLLSVLVYDAYPKGTWQELHTLHRLACRYHLEALEIRDELQTPDAILSSIDLCYRRMVLFCLSSPFKIRQKENIQIFNALMDWGGHTRIYHPDEAPADATITLKQDSDTPPSHGSFSPDADSNHLLQLDASKLIETIREHFDEDVPKSTLKDLGNLDKSLLRQLIQLWSNTQKRTFVRTKLNFELRVAVGLCKIYQLVAEGKSKQSEEQETQSTWVEKNFSDGNLLDISARFTLEPLDSHNRHESRRDGFEEFGPSTFDTEKEEPPLSIWDKTSSNDASESTYQFHTLNESAGGYCLEWKGEDAPKILVGELIGVQSAMANSQFGVGLVRWMKSNPHENLQVGLQMIAPNAIPVTAKHKLRKNQNSHECLLLPEVGTSGQPTSFICPTFPFSVGDLLMIDDGKTTREIRLTRLYESSGAISQFQFTYQDEQGASLREKEDDELTSDSEFDNLWSTL